MGSKAIRDNVSTVLLAAAPVAALVGTRVKIGRGHVTGSATWPAIFLYPEREEIDTHTLSENRQQMRTLTLIVDYWVKAPNDTTVIEDSIETGANAIESALLADTTRGGAAADTVLTSLDYTTEGKEDTRFGVGRLTFAIKFFTQEP